MLASTLPAPTKVVFRPYQDAASHALQSGWTDGFTSQLVVQATGTGKTVVAAREVAIEISKGGRVLFLAHREELLDQAKAQFDAVTGICAWIEKSDQRASLSDMAVLGSVQTLCREGRLKRFPPDHFSLIVIDEAHHSLAASYDKILKYFTGARLIGLTATPDRGDKKDLGKVFQRVAFEYSLIDAVKEGYLARPVVKTIPLKLDMDKVEVRGGDFAEEQVGDALTPILPEIARALWEEARERKLIVFMPTIKTSQLLSDELARAGFKSNWIAGISEDRKEKLDTFKELGAGSALVNAMLLLEGYDCSSIDAVCVLRATKVRALYAQAVGRATRIHPGKTNCLILDFLWHSSRHLLVKPAHLIAKTKEIAERATKKFDWKGAGTQDLIEGIIDAEQDHLDALARAIRKHAHKRGSMIDPLDLGKLLDDLDTAEYEPMSDFDRQPKKIWQRELLEKGGVDPNLVTCYGHAAHIIEKMEERRRLGLGTLKQVRKLKQYGYHDAARYSFVRCTDLIIQLVKNQWRRPSNNNGTTMP